jgi:hypothetical protein
MYSNCSTIIVAQPSFAAVFYIYYFIMLQLVINYFGFPSLHLWQVPIFL